MAKFVTSSRLLIRDLYSTYYKFYNSCGGGGGGEEKQRNILTDWQKQNPKFSYTDKTRNSKLSFSRNKSYNFFNILFVHQKFCWYSMTFWWHVVGLFCTDKVHMYRQSKKHWIIIIMIGNRKLPFLSLPAPLLISAHIRHRGIQSFARGVWPWILLWCLKGRFSSELEGASAIK